MSNAKTIVREALERLPGTSRGVASYLWERRCFGSRGSSYHCPVAEYLKEELKDSCDDPEVIVRLWYVKVELTDGSIFRVWMPWGVLSFTNQFDMGRWNELSTW